MIPSIYIDALKKKDDGSVDNVIISQEKHHHIARVLRLKSGENVVVFDGRGTGYLSTIFALDKNHTELKIIKVLGASAADTGKDTIIAQSICTSQKMDWTVEKMTELGVRTIIPLCTQHSQAVANERRLNRLCIAASEQCGRYRLPQITPAITLQQWLSSLAPLEPLHNRYVLSCQSSTPLSHALKQSKINQSYIIVIGPEKGLTKEEEEQLVKAGFIATSLGERTLRTETAALVALTVVNEFSMSV